jgi:heterodisulfide reductase subunit B
MASDEIATKLSSVRALASAKAKGNDLITVCSACHNVIKQTNEVMKTDENMVLKVNNYLKLTTEKQVLFIILKCSVIRLALIL